MGHIVHPRAYLIAETHIDLDAVSAALTPLGAGHWLPAGEGSDAAYLTEFAGKSCYMSFDTSLNKNLTRTGARSTYDYIQKSIIANGHGSVLEHASVTFFLANVSRVVTHELIRHRAGTAFSQTSGRYVRTDRVDAYIPEDVKGKALDIWQRAIAQMEENMAALTAETDVAEQSFKVKKRLTSAFRRLIGNGQANHLVMTANHRAWRHIIALRTAEDAEEEIRVVIGDVAAQLKAKFPAIYGDMHENEKGEWTFTHPKV